MLKRHSVLVTLAFFAAFGMAASIAAQTPIAPSAEFCKLLTKAEAGAALGAEVTEATPEAAQGSLLGGCKYPSGGGVIMLNARPAREFDASVKAYKDLTAVDVAGVKAFHSPTVGMLMSQPGKPYFLHIMMVGGKGPKTSERFIALAKLIVAKG